MDTYIDCIPVIQRLVDNHLLGIDLKNRLVLIDISLHLMHVSAYSGKSMKQANKRYASFMDKVVAFMNFQLGRMGARDIIDPTKETIRFFVTQKEIKCFDDEGNHIPAHMQVNEKTILIGMYKHGEINYREIGSNGQM